MFCPPRLQLSRLHMRVKSSGHDERNYEEFSPHARSLSTASPPAFKDLEPIPTEAELVRNRFRKVGRRNGLSNCHRTRESRKMPMILR